MANPQNRNLYQALSVLWQVACEVKLLHTVSGALVRFGRDFTAVREAACWCPVSGEKFNSAAAFSQLWSIVGPGNSVPLLLSQIFVFL